jgi:hypothetical protein
MGSLEPDDPHAMVLHHFGSPSDTLLISQRGVGSLMQRDLLGSRVIQRRLKICSEGMYYVRRIDGQITYNLGRLEGNDRITSLGWVVEIDDGNRLWKLMAPR